MKGSFRRRLGAGLVCLVLALGLSACGKQNDAPPAGGSGETNGVAGSLSGVKGGKDKAQPGRPATVDREQAESSLQELRESMAFSDEMIFAVAYLGYRPEAEDSDLTEWLGENCAPMLEYMPFLLTIPPERILGGEDGELFCIIPRYDDSTVAVNRIQWVYAGNGTHLENQEVLYRSEYGEPLLVFAHYEQMLDEPDVEIVVTAGQGASTTWYPGFDEDGWLIKATDENGYFTMMDAGTYVYGDEWEDGDPEGDGWWLPPTDWGLADTTWNGEPWFIELNWGDSDPEYSGTAVISYQAEAGQEYQTAYTGAWRMEDDCLRLEIYSVDTGEFAGGSFPVLIDPSGENLYITQARTGECPPFFGEGITAMGLLRSYG